METLTMECHKFLNGLFLQTYLQCMSLSSLFRVDKISINVNTNYHKLYNTGTIEGSNLHI